MTETHEHQSVCCPSDRVEELACARLRQSAYLELRRITCSIKDKILCLQGYVSSYYLRQIAQALVQGLDGVKAIDNQLEVIPARLSREQVGLA